METTSPVYDPYFCASGHILDYDKTIPVCRSPARTQVVDCPVEGDEGPTPPLGGPVRVIEGGKEVCKDFEFSAVKTNEKPSYIDVTVAATGQKTRIRF
ncbi:hypothetical protein [Microvirga alba]|uniref:Uncharacterized protein n=1 Tax=Microvirga alba TaxID=2791025 RepID=A0A931BVR1_9HYPH|nr:hypothetical protein [Microvirga alba]MBF9235604.1 hypothetical protein [Microvirga alba]